MFQDATQTQTQTQIQPPHMNDINIDLPTAVRFNKPYQPYQPTYVPTSVPSPGPDLLTLSVIGANLLFVAPFAYVVWGCSLFTPQKPMPMPNVE